MPARNHNSLHPNHQTPLRERGPEAPCPNTGQQTHYESGNGRYLGTVSPEIRTAGAEAACVKKYISRVGTSYHE